MRSRAAELMARQYRVTEEQIAGIIDGKIRVLQPVADALRQEERDLYRSKGQPAAASLSRAGGVPTDTELTPQALAEMSDERFAEVLNELQARGDKTKLMQLSSALKKVEG